MRNTDVFVLPSLSRPNWLKQFGRVLIEAMACGVPVIGSTCGEIPNVLGEAGLIFPEGQVEALAACLCALLTNPARVGALYSKTNCREDGGGLSFAHAVIRWGENDVC